MSIFDNFQSVNMAQHKQTAVEFVRDAFSPLVAVSCSHDADVFCQKNNLSFVQLTQPFCKLTSEAHIRDPGNISHTIHNLKVTMRDMNSTPPQPVHARKMLSDVVNNALPQNFDLSKSGVVSVGNYDLQMSASTQWFEAYRECFLQVVYPSDHEFLRHYLACIFVVSSSNADPINQFVKLTQSQHQQQHQYPNKLPSWFCPNILHYYVLVHDVLCEEESKAEAIYQSMKSTYGVNNCHLLQINSRSPDIPDPTPNATLPDPWSKFLVNKEGDSRENLNEVSELSPVESAVEVTEIMVGQTSSPSIDHPLADNAKVVAPNNTPLSNNNPDSVPQSRNIPSKISKLKQRGCCLSLSDHDRLRIFIHEFMVRGLIPWAERTLRQLNEQVATRRGMGRTILSGAKKFFGGNKPSTPHQNMDRTNVVYTLEAPEMQARRLADLAFMFQLYEMAYQTYNACKRDFNNDHAWLHHAGAMEMAGISIFMQGSNILKQYPQHYVDEAIRTYLNCKLPHFATRAALLSTEALKSKAHFQEAALLFIKMTSEDSDLRSALLLEQAAHCFIRTPQAMVRKYSFHLILAGHRFSKCGQRRHALRTYAQALQIYKGKQWSLAEDHINFTLGRQSFNLKQLENATLAFKHLLTENSKQSAPQQNAFLKEYLFIFKQLQNQSSTSSSQDLELPQLPLPLVNTTHTKVLCCHPHSAKVNKVSACSTTLNSDECLSATWQKLEELLVVHTEGTLANNQPNVQCYTSYTDNRASPLSVVGERIQVEVCLMNPVKVPIVLGNILLLWDFVPNQYGEEVNQENPGKHVSNEGQSQNLSHLSEIIDTQNIPEVVLQPIESIKLQLCLLVKQTGQLHITGLSYNLGTSPAMQSSPVDNISGENQPNNFVSGITVRGKVNLECQGARLNNTKTEKATKMYATDRRLDLVIVPPMPKLEVHFCDFPQTMLQGEVRQVMIEFTNTGTVPLTNLKVASTDPTFFSFGGCQRSTTSSPTNDLAFTKPDSSSVYNTLSSDRDSQEFVVEEPRLKFIENVPLETCSGRTKTGVLAPDETVAVPMWIYGPCSSKDSVLVGGVGGSHGVVGLSREYDMQMMFMYQTVNKDGSPNKMKYRVLRHNVQIQLHPSLQLHAAATRRRHSATFQKTPSLECLSVSLGVESLNTSTEDGGLEFSLLQVSSVSQTWRLDHLTTQRYSDMKMGSRESTLMNFLSTKCQGQSLTSTQQIFSNVTFDQHPIDSAATPCSDFYYRSMSKETFESVEVEPPKASVLPDEVKSVISQSESVKQSQDIDLSLIVLWKACRKGTAASAQCYIGQHHIHLSELNSSIHNPLLNIKQIERGPVKLTKDVELSGPVYPSEKTLSQVIKYSLCYQHRIMHNFTKKKMCTVDVTLTCLNTSPLDVRLDIDTGQLQRFVENSLGDLATAHHVDLSSEQAQFQSQPVTATATTPSPAHQQAPNPPPPPPQASLPPQAPPTPRHLGSFLWISRQMSTVTLTPGQSVDLPLKAAFCKAGVYNVGSLSVKAGPATGYMDGLDVELTEQKSVGPSLIVISASQ